MPRRPPARRSAPNASQEGHAVDATALLGTGATARDGGSAEEIRMEGVSKVYPDGTVGVAELDLTFAAGELTVLVGPSGCGKTTTMKMINRIIEPSTGRILLGGEDVTRVDPERLRRRIGYVIQSVGLFPHQTVRTNVGTVPRLLGWDKARIRARVDELLATVGLDPAVHGDRYPAQLSGGQPPRASPAAAPAPRRCPGPRPPIPGFCWWRSRSPPSTRWCATGCRRSSCGCRRRSARRSSSSPTTSRRRSASGTASRS